MVYKPRKTVNGHKRNDRATRRRKARDARKRRLAARPVRSNIKRYVAEQFGKTHPDNRFYQSNLPTLKPTNKLDDTPRYYPFGATFQRDFLRMEFQRMKEVVAQTPANAAIIGGQSLTHIARLNKAVGNHNHWKSLLGRGIHMKHASVYGTISLNEQIPLRMEPILKYGNLKLHMFVLEDKAVTKSEFLNWYKDFLKTSAVSHTVTENGVTKTHHKPGSLTTAANSKMISEHARYITSSDGVVDHGSYDTDLINVPYVAGSQYASTYADTSGKYHVCGEVTPSGKRATSGFDEFLIDWSKFYKIDNVTNPHHSLFYNEVKCTTEWDGTRANSLLPVNKSRFIVHDHKTWSFKPKPNGCVDTVVPFEYSFPEHYMHYDKELLDMPFVWNEDTGETDKDDRGLHFERLYPRKQPFIVFLYTCDNPMMIDHPDRYHDVHYSNTNKTATVASGQNHPGHFTVKAGGDPNDGSNTAVDSNVPLSDKNRHLDPNEQSDGDIHMRTVDPNSRAANESTVYEWIHAETSTVQKGDVFSIDLRFKCTYENKLATSVVPTINKGRPIIHKRESAPKKRTSAKRPRGPPREMESRKVRKTNRKDNYEVRRYAGHSSARRPTFDQMEAAEYAARKEARERSRMMRDGIRSHEIAEYKAALEHHGHTHASAKQMLRSVVREAMSTPTAVESGVMAALGRYAGHSIPGSAVINQAFAATYNNPVFRDWFVGVLEDAGLPTNAQTLKMALRIALRQRPVGGIDH